MAITQTLRIEIADCLEMFPGIEELGGRQALVAQADLDAELAKRITYGGSVHAFCSLLVADLEEYGRLEDGYHPLEAILDAVRASVDAGDRRRCDLILTDLRVQLSVIGVGELIRSRWYVLLSGLTFCAILLAAVGYVLPVVGQPVSGPTSSEGPNAMEVAGFTPTPIKVVMAQATVGGSEPLVTGSLPIAAGVAANTPIPDVSALAIEPLSPTITESLTERPRATETMEARGASLATPTRTPTSTATAPVALPSATSTPVATRTSPASPTATHRLVLARTPAVGLTPIGDALERVIEVDAPEAAFRDIRGKYTLSGLAVQCLDDSSSPLMDAQGFPLIIPLEGMEGLYALPERTKKVLLWVDSKVYGDWWNYYSTGAEDVGEQEIIVLRVVERPSSQPGWKLPDRRWKTPDS